jgi:hypothetical protein
MSVNVALGGNQFPQRMGKIICMRINCRNIFQLQIVKLNTKNGGIAAPHFLIFNCNYLIKPSYKSFHRCVLGKA